MTVFSGILTGILAVQGLRKGLKNQVHSKSSGGLRVAQNMPGRLRLYCPQLKGSETANALRVQLIRIDGILQVSVNETTGSALTLYNPDKLESDLLISLFSKLLGTDPQLPPDKPSLIMKEVQLVGRSVNCALQDKTMGLLDVKTVLPMVFTGIAIKEIMRTGALGTPSPLTLLYWSYNMFNTRGNNNDV